MVKIIKRKIAPKLKHKKTKIGIMAQKMNYHHCLDILIDTIAENVPKKVLIYKIVKSQGYKKIRKFAKIIESGKTFKCDIIIQKSTVNIKKIKLLPKQ